MSTTCYWIRKSSEDEGKQAYSIENQRQKNKEYAENHNLPLPDPQDIFIDETPGDDVDSEVKIKFINALKSGKYKDIVTYSIDRLGRSIFINNKILNIIKDKKITLHLSQFSQKLLPNAIETELIFQMLTCIAQYENKERMKRVRDGLYTKAKKEGQFNAPKPPYGFRCEIVNGVRKLVPIPEEEKIVKMIFNLALYFSCAFIAAKLNSLKKPYRNGKKWTKKTVYNVLKNRCYCGYIEYRKTYNKKEGSLSDESEFGIKFITKRVKNSPLDIISFPNAHKSIIPEDIFEEVQEALKKRYSIITNSLNKHLYLLGGIVYCTKCGKMNCRHYSSNLKEAEKKNNFYYVCKCSKYNANQIETEVISLLKKFITDRLPPNVILPSINDLKREEKRLEIEIKKKELAIQNLRATIEKFPQEELKEIKERIIKLNEEIKKYQRQIRYIQKLMEVIPSKRKVKHLLKHFLSFENIPRDERYALLCSTVKKVEVSPGIKKIKIYLFFQKDIPLSSVEFMEVFFPV